MREVLYIGKEVGVVVDELRQEKRGRHRRSWKGGAEIPSWKTVVGRDWRLGMWVLSGTEEGDKGDL